jgi:hypothetical protein
MNSGQELFGRSPKTHHPTSMFHIALEYPVSGQRGRKDSAAARRRLHVVRSFERSKRILYSMFDNSGVTSTVLPLMISVIKSANWGHRIALKRCVKKRNVERSLNVQFVKL